jgi:hypothetical protein
MIRNKRNTLSLYRRTKGATGTLPTEALVRTFLGRIDKNATATGFNKGKVTTIVSPILFCDVDEVFISKDLVQDIDGQRYVVVEGTQPDGVSGISPTSFKAHKEIVLEKVQ